jgi:putative membrane protein
VEPDLRILQANERTLLAWIRTGLALMAFGIVLARIAIWLRVEHPEQHGDVSTWLGVVLIALGIACNIIGAVRFVAARRAIVENRSFVPSASGPIGVAIAVGALGAAAIVYAIASA